MFAQINEPQLSTNGNHIHIYFRLSHFHEIHFSLLFSGSQPLVPFRFIFLMIFFCFCYFFIWSFVLRIVTIISTRSRAFLIAMIDGTYKTTTVCQFNRFECMAAYFYMYTYYIKDLTKEKLISWRVRLMIGECLYSFFLFLCALAVFI